MHPKICFTKFACFFSRSLKLIILSVGSYTGHIVHGHSSGSFDAGVDCRRIDRHAAPATDTDDTDTLGVHILLHGEEVYRCAEILGVDVRRSVRVRLMSGT